MSPASVPPRLLWGLVLCLALAPACADDGTGPPEPPPEGPLLRGTVHAVGGGPVEGLWAVWRAGEDAAADSARVGADGAFEIRATTDDPDGELLIDGPEPRTYHPFLHPVRADSLDGADLLVIPREWRVHSGVHEGEAVPTPLDPAVDDNAPQMLYSYFFGQPRPRDAPELYLLDLMTWPEETLPARVAIDHGGSTAEVTPGDSTAIWGVLERMEEVTGLDLFEPAVADASWWTDADGPGGQPFEPGVIRLVHDSAQWRGLGQAQVEARVRERDLVAWAREGPFSAYRERHRRLNGGYLVVGPFEALRLGDGFVPWETVLVHETLHVLGLGHTCRIPSPMGPCMRTAEVSRHDVAYMELLRRTIRLVRELDAPFGLMPSVIGERRVLLGESALPRLEGGRLDVP